MVQRGKLIVLEGVDGAGTTTQARLIQASLESLGLKAVITAQPSLGPIGTLIRSILRGEVTRVDNTPIGPVAIAALFAADRSEHIETQLDPWLDEGYHVICDRYYHSSLAYQGLELGVEFVAQLNAKMMTPDMIFFVDTDPEVAAGRREIRNSAAELYEVETFQQRLRAAYHEAFELRDKEQVIHIDGNGSIEQIHALIMERINSELS